MANTYRHTADFAPYYDDWESAGHDDKGYVKVLFKPSVAVQARELNQTQTYLNNQIASLGGYLFKDGTPVSGAKISYVTNQKYAVASIMYSASDNFEAIKDSILNQNHKVTDTVIGDISSYTLRGTPVSQIVESSTTQIDSDTGETSGSSQTTSATDPVIQITGFFEYENPNDSENEDNTAVLNSITSIIGSTVVKRVIILFNLYGGEFQSNQAYNFNSNDRCTIRFDSIGTCTTASCTKGIIFVDGYFINVPMTTVLVNPFNELDINYPLASFGIKDISNDDVEYNIGFWIERDIVTAYEDTTLVDPASGSYNYKAPGADRYKILGKLCSLTDEKLEVELDNKNGDTQVKFVSGIVLKNNVLIKEQNNVGTNSDLMDEMARRTYEESGSYSVNPWKVQIEEQPDDSSKYVVSVEPGLGYVYGYRVSNVVSQKFKNEKSRNVLLKKNNSKYTDSSRCTYTENLYVDDAEIKSVLNLNMNMHYCNSENVITASKCFLIDNQIAENFKIRGTDFDNERNTYRLDRVLDKQAQLSNLSIATVDDKSVLQLSNNTIANVVGELTISNVVQNGDGSLILYVNNFNDEKGITYELSNARSIISVFKKDDGTYSITGYIDLKIDDVSKMPIWENNETPYIFETDYSYVANTNYDAFKFSYNSVLHAHADSNSYIINDNNADIIFSTTYTALPEIETTIVLLTDSTGKVYSPVEYKLINDGNTSSKNFTIRITPRDGHTIPISGTTFDVFYIATLTDNKTTDTNLIKTKILKIKTCYIHSDSIGSDDVVTLNDFDAVALLSIKLSDDNSDNNTSNTTGTNNNNSNVHSTVIDLSPNEIVDENAVEAYYEESTNVDETVKTESRVLSKNAKYITLDPQATDYCYKKSKIYGIKRLIDARNAASQDGATSNTSTDKKIVIITYAYYDHVSSGTQGCYTALSYEVDPSLINRNGVSIYVERLYDYFGISGLYETTSEMSSTSNVASDVYKIIPIYKSLTGSQYNLANCFDFRQDYDENSTTSSTDNTTTFFPINPLPESNINYDIPIFLPRIDNVWVDKTGNFGITNGIPSESPYPPAEIDGAMTLYRLYNRPYGISISDIIPTYIDNTRHTMKDISSLTERVTALEEVVSMSLIEQSAINLQITDDDGITRYKCGIFTDTFSNFNNCNLNDAEWSASIDSVEKSVRPYFVNIDWSISPIGEYTLPKKEGSNLTSVNGYKLTDNGNLYSLDAKQKLDDVICWNNSVITLKPIDLSGKRDKKMKYTNSTETYASNWKYPSIYSYIYAKNINCTETTNVQSLMFATWSGNLTLFPAIDTWVNDLGDILSDITYEETEKPANIYRSWTSTSTDTFDTTEVTTKASGLSTADIRKLYGSDKAATAAGKLHQRVVPAGTKVANAIGSGGVGHWEPAETTTTIRSFETTTTTTTTETTTYTGSYIANDVATYMEEQDAFMRVRFVEFSLKGMRPSNQLYATMDGVPLKIISVDEFNDGLTPEVVNSKKSDYNTAKTDANGDANGYILIPDKMPVGTKVVQFFDSEKLATCHADYTANGKTVWNNINRTYIRQWNPVTTQSTKTKTSDPVFTGATRTITATEIFKEEDPIAESFYISQENGIMLEAIDIFFAAKDISIGVELFIVECENGYPGQTIVPFSRVFVPAANVNITTKTTLENSPVKTLPKPTTFKFPVPIYLQPKQEYAFIVIAPSYNYEIYTSTLGKADLVTGYEIKEQPYTGSMFKSQNLRTWTAEQMQDIMFVMYSMKFNTKADGYSVYFGLDDMMSRRTLGTTTLPKNIDETNNAYDMMNLSAGTFTPNMTDIRFKYRITQDNTQQQSSMADETGWIGYNNKQDIFLEDPAKMYANPNNYTGSQEDTESSTSPSATFMNYNTSLSVKAILSTGDENVTPQIDIEDFHGVFARNVISSKSVKINYYDYFKAGTYVSNAILLKEPAIGIKVIMDAILPNNSLIKTYYKMTNIASKYFTIMPKVDSSNFINQVVKTNNSHVNDPNSTNSSEELSSNAAILNTKISSQIGVSYTNLDAIYNKLCYVWYHVYDCTDKRYKFICPTQLDNTMAINYVPPSFIPTKGDLVEKDETLSSDETLPSEGYEIIINKANMPNAFKDAVITQDTNDPNITTFSYGSIIDNSEYNIIGIYAIPEDSYMYKPSEIIDYRTNDNMNRIINKQYTKVVNTQSESQDDTTNTSEQDITCIFKTITISDYNPAYTYFPGEMCIYRNVLYINKSNSNITNVAPVSSSDTLGWCAIPCVLMTNKYTEKLNDNSSWIEMQCNEYKNTTERQTNFMEYNYSTMEQSNDTNFFDEFTLKIELYCKDQCNVPRFRNLRAIAVV